jgi:predicted aspartyl protease
VKRALSRAFDPPAPMVPVRIRVPDGLDSAELEGKLDTGADLCAIPDRYVAELDLPPLRTVRAAGFLGGLQDTIVYRVDIAIDGMHFPAIEAVATRRPYVIVGRNILRRVVMRVDGPAEKLEIGLPKARKRAG